MKIFSLSSILFFTIIFSYSIVAQDIGVIKKISGYSIPEKISAPMGDPLPAGTYSIGSGGDFPTIDSAFNKLSIDGIAGEVTLELIDNLYTAPTDTFGFLLVGPITGAGENSRVIIKPAQNHQVTIEGNGGAVLYFSNTSYITLDGVTLGGSTTLTINSFYNNQYTANDGLDFLDDSDHNIVKNLQVNCEDYTRYSVAIGFWTNSAGAIGAPDSNLIENNNIIQACLAIYVSAYFANVYGFDNIIRDNLISASTGNIIRWGIQFEKNENTIAENNIVENLMNSVSNLEAAIGINAHRSNSCTIRNNIVHSISSDIRNGSTGIMLSAASGYAGNNNMIYNNMVFDIQSTSINSSSRVAGIQIWRNNNPKIYYNSVNLSGTGSNILGSAAFYLSTACTNVEAYDNIFVNTRDESNFCASSIRLWDYPTLLSSDNNDLYYQPNQYNCLVRAAGGDYLNLEEWQATGHDMHSISEMPNFIALDDLHIDESIPTNLESGAIPIDGIDTDFDGDLRHATTPDIGADEFDGMAIDTLYVPGDYTTIQEAIDAAVNGNLVLVADGTYYENINYKGKAITVASHFLVDGDTSHISNTVIDGSQPSHLDSGSVVSFISGEDTTSILCGFTITGGTGTYNPVWTEFEGGGIFCSHSGAKIVYNKIVENEAIHTFWAAGGGIFMDFEETQRWIVIENNIISNNYVESGDGVASGGGIFSGNNSRIVNNIIENNNCLNSAPTYEYIYGAGIGIDGSPNWSHTVYCINNTIRENKLLGGGYNGGAGIWMDDGNFYIKNNEIISNQILGNTGSTEQGAGIIITNPDEECYIEENRFIQNNGAFGQGGALYIRGAETTSIKIDKNLVGGNSIALGGGFALYETIDISITNNIFTKNEALFSGGAILFSTSPIELQMSIDQSGRSAENTSHISTEQLLHSQPVLINNTFNENTALNGNGGAIYTEVNLDLIIFNTIFWENESMIGKDLYQSSNTQMYIYYSDIETDSIYGNWIGDHNIYADPHFVDAANGNFHLQDNISPCLQTGIDSIDIGGTLYHSPPFCFYGITRPTPAGTMPDMGACENPVLVGVDDRLFLIPDHFSLSQNYPNPFNPTTKIKFTIPLNVKREMLNVTLKVYDILGNEVATLVNEEKPAGSYEVEFNATSHSGEVRNLPSGVYFYQLKAGSFIDTKKMLLIK